MITYSIHLTPSTQKLNSNFTFRRQVVIKDYKHKSGDIKLW